MYFYSYFLYLENHFLNLLELLFLLILPKGYFWCLSDRWISFSTANSVKRCTRSGVDTTVVCDQVPHAGLRDSHALCFPKCWSSVTHTWITPASALSLRKLPCQDCVLQGDGKGWYAKVLALLPDLGQPQSYPGVRVPDGIGWSLCCHHIIYGIYGGNYFFPPFNSVSITAHRCFPVPEEKISLYSSMFFWLA